MAQCARKEPERGCHSLAGESVVNDAKVSKNNRKTTLLRGKFFLAFTKRPAPYIMDMRRDQHQHFLIPLKKVDK